MTRSPDRPTPLIFPAGGDLTVPSLTAMAARSLSIASADVHGDLIAAGDANIPAVVLADSTTGDVLAVHTWPLSPEHRGRPRCTDVALTADEVIVASPAAGGLVRIDRATGTTTVIAFDTDVRRVFTGPGVVWVVAAPRPVDPDETLRPRTVEWEEPTPEEVMAYREEVSGFVVRSPDGDWVPLADMDEPLPTAED